MASNSSGCASYEVKFIIHSGRSQNDATDTLKLAFEAMECNGLDPTWIKEEDCLKMKEKEPKLFICDPFEGEAFQHLITLNCRVMGPLCILTCLAKGETLPKRAHPVYSLTMRKISVTCSNVSKEMREEISKKVLLMGGLFCKDLTKSVTHLIVGEVGSKKYHVAANFNIPIMLPEWIEECWNTEQYNQRHATDTLFERFRCPVFKGLTITVSQLSSEERKTAQELIEKNGGRYSGILKAKETTHLVLTEPIGEKYKFAKAWQLFCVKVEWMYDSLNAGHCMNEMLYQLEAKPVEHGHSTPKKENNNDSETKKRYQAPDCSSIEDVSILSRLDETAQSDVTIVPTKRQSDKHLQMNVLNSLDVSKLPKTSQFLDGCRIFLSGFHGLHLDKLRKIISAGGGARFSKLGESVTHVVLGDRDSEVIKSIVDSSVRPHVVSYHWLVDCCKQQKLLDEATYTCLENIPLSPNEKNQMHLSSQPPPIKKAVPQFNGVPQCNATAAEQDDFKDIMKQYLPVDETKDTTFALNTEIGKRIESEQNSDLVQTVIEGIDQEMKGGDKDSSYQHDSPDNIFINHTFMIFGFGPKDTELLAEMVEAGSGMTLNCTVSRCADVGIVPITGCEITGTVKEVVTNCWLQMCTESEMLLPFDANPLFRPINVKENCEPLSDCVLTFSQYMGTERDCLMHLAEVLGAQCQEYFVHKGNKSRGLLPNTHLVVSSPEGSKYEASKKWKIPAVTKFWLFAAAETGTKPEEEKYLVENIEADDDIVNVEPNNQRNAVASVIEPSNLNVQFSESNTKKDKIGEKLQMEGPSTARNHRIKELIKSEQATIFQKPTSGDSETPSKFLNPDSEYHPNYDVNDLLASLDSPGSQINQGINGRARKSSLPLEELFSHNMEVALKNFGHDVSAFNAKEGKEFNEQQANYGESSSSSSDSNFRNIAHTSEAHLKHRPLSGVVIYVSKKLNSKQGELNNIVASLGGDYRWSYDSSCTHFIFQGRVNDITREFRIAREHGKKIVSPEWIYSCRDANKWVDESLYPHNHNPRMSLSGQISSKRVPENIYSEKSGNEFLKKDVTVNSHYKSTDKEEDNFSEKSTDVSKQLEEFLTAAKCVKTSKRWSRRLNSSGSTSPVAGENLKNKRPSTSRGTENNQLNKDRVLPQPESLPTEPSQSIPITWDDPTGRLEREKIAEQLAYGPDTLDTQSQSPEPINTEPAQAHPTAECNKLDCIEVETQVPRKFMLSGLSEKEKEMYMTIIEDLGGIVSDGKTSDVTATHLILGQPLKNEKYLAAVASGIWVLHKSYLEACKEAGQFVEEEAHEWGGPATYQVLEKLPEKLAKVALCPRRWRVNLEQSDGKKAFHNWKVIVIAERQKAATYGRILTAGGAELLSVESPYSDCQQATHALVELSKSALAKVDFVSLVSNGVSCLKPEYLAFYLVEDPSPPERDYTISQAMELLQNSSAEVEPGKRKPNTHNLRTNVNNKRNRQT